MVSKETARWIVLAASVNLALTGLVLIVSPAVFAAFILGAEVSEVGQALGRIAGAAMLGFALASWPRPVTAYPPISVVRALLSFNFLATIYLAYLGATGGLVGVLLWPAVAVHGTFAILLARRGLVGKAT